MKQIKCPYCGGTVERPKARQGFYCSRNCRLLMEINKTPTCWNWTGVIGDQGYGQMSWENQINTSPRHAYMEWKGDIPEGLVVRHKCDNKKCCNPDHLELGTPKDNVRDRYDRGTGIKVNGMTRTKEQVLKIVEDLKTMTPMEVSTKHNVSVRTIREIKKGRSYQYWTGINKVERKKARGRNDIYMTHQGKTQSLRAWANELNVKVDLIYDRRAKGMSVEEILSPKHSNYRFIRRKPKSQD